MWRGSSHLYLSTRGTNPILVLAPGHYVPGERFIGWAALRFESKRVTDFVRSQRVRQRHTVLRVAVDAVGPDFRHQFRNRIGPGFTLVSRALVPHHHREQHFHSSLMEVGDHLPHACHTSRHAADQVMLIAIVDAHVRISGPDQNRVDATVALVQIIEIAVHRVLVRHWIVKITVLHHHLRLKKTGLCPL